MTTELENLLSWEFCLPLKVCLQQLKEYRCALGL